MCVVLKWRYSGTQKFQFETKSCGLIIQAGFKIKGCELGITTVPDVAVVFPHTDMCTYLKYKKMGCGGWLRFYLIKAVMPGVNNWCLWWFFLSQYIVFYLVLCYQIMQDEVSETENIRKNLAIERMIVEGCDILLDVNQTFVRQGQWQGTDDVLSHQSACWSHNDSDWYNILLIFVSPIVKLTR